MDYSLDQFRMRERKEQELKTLQFQAKGGEDMYKRIDKVFNKKLLEYQKWKEDNKMTGLNF